MILFTYEKYSCFLIKIPNKITQIVLMYLYLKIPKILFIKIPTIPLCDIFGKIEHSIEKFIQI